MSPFGPQADARSWFGVMTTTSHAAITPATPPLNGYLQCDESSGFPLSPATTGVAASLRACGRASMGFMCAASSNIFVVELSCALRSTSVFLIVMTFTGR